MNLLKWEFWIFDLTKTPNMQNISITHDLQSSRLVLVSIKPRLMNHNFWNQWQKSNWWNITNISLFCLLAMQTNEWGPKSQVPNVIIRPRYTKKSCIVANGFELSLIFSKSCPNLKVLEPTIHAHSNWVIIHQLAELLHLKLVTSQRVKFIYVGVPVDITRDTK